MGKVKDELSTSKIAKPSKAKPRGPLGGTFGLFLVNLLQTGLYKPMQGWYARLYTALGLGVIAAAGVWRSTSRRSVPLWRLEPSNGLGALLGWMNFRIIHFPPLPNF
jgi:preprotein translocase subunit SecE